MAVFATATHARALVASTQRLQVMLVGAPPVSETVKRGHLQQSAVDLEATVRRAQAGEAQAFEHLARTYLRPAYSVSLAIVRRPSDAEDVAQDAVMAALQRIDTCREPARFSAWLMTIVRNYAKNLLVRRRLRDVPRESELAEPMAKDQDVDAGFERDRLLAALGHLNVAEREVVLLHDLEGFTHQDIADALGISCVMSRQHLFVARRKLRSVLADTMIVGGDHE